MPKTYKAFIKEYDMGITIPSMSFLKPTASMKLKRKDEKAKKEDARDDDITGKKVFKPAKHMPKDSAGKLDVTEPKIKGADLRHAKKVSAKPNARNSLMGMPSTKFKGLAFTQSVPNYTKA